MTAAARGKGSTGTRWTAFIKKGLIEDQRGKAKSVVLGDAGLNRSQELLAALFAKRLGD